MKTREFRINEKLLKHLDTFKNGIKIEDIRSIRIRSIREYKEDNCYLLLSEDIQQGIRINKESFDKAFKNRIINK